MRWISKGDRPPAALRAFLEANLPIEVNLDYRHGFNRKNELRQELVALQGGICAYTGVAIDARLEHRQNAGPADGLRYAAHTEHLKPQSLCRQELLERGLEPGRHLGEDLDHRNLVAALEVKRARGSRREIFGAAARPPGTLLPVVPTQQDCESKFRYLADGRVEGLDQESRLSVSRLKLDHETLAGWRRSAWDVFVELYLASDEDQASRLRQSLNDRVEDRFLEFGFVLEGILADLEGRPGSPRGAMR